MRTAFVLVALALLAPAAPALAGKLQPPLVPYTADVALARGSGRADFRIQSAGEHVRLESAGKIVVLFDLARGDIVSYLPGRYAVERLPDGFDPRLFGLRVDDAEVEGREILIDRPVTRYKITGRTSRGPFVGHIWTTVENIPVRILVAEGRDTQGPNFGIEVGHLETGAIDPARFAVPAGSVKVAPQDLHP